MKTKLILLSTLLLITLTSASADVTYLVTVNTSSLPANTSGYLDFQFNPGPLPSQSATVTIGDFSSDGILAGSPTLTGDASGSLPGAATLVNGTAYNDYFEGFIFGDTLSFDVVLSGPGVNTPDGSAAGSSFAFSMFGSDGVTPLLTNDVTNGLAFTVDLNSNGTTTPTDLSPETTGTLTPEPASMVLFGTGLLCMIFLTRKRHSTDS